MCVLADQCGTRTTAYTLRAHPRTYLDGPGGVIDTGVKDPDGSGPMVAPKAVSGNPAWEGMNTQASFWLGNFPPANVNNQDNYSTGANADTFALIWYSDNSQTAYHDAALYLLNNVDQFLSTLCYESVTGPNGCSDDAYYLSSYGPIYWYQEWMLAFELMYNEMTPDATSDVR